MLECISRKNYNNWEIRQKSDQLIYQCISPGNWIYVAAEAKSLPYSSNVTNGSLYWQISIFIRCDSFSDKVSINLNYFHLKKEISYKGNKLSVTYFNISGGHLWAERAKRVKTVIVWKG